MRSATRARRVRPRDAFGLDGVAAVARRPAVSTSVTGTPVDVDGLGHEIARRAGNVGDDRAAGAGEPVEQARLAGVRPPDDRDLRALAHEPAAPGVGQQRVEPLDDRAGSPLPRSPGSTK